MSRRIIASIVLLLLVPSSAYAQRLENEDPRIASYGISKLKVGAQDWPQWGGTSLRNSAAFGRDIPVDWNIETGLNIKWSAKLGSQSYGSPIVANGRIFISSNNGGGYLKRLPSNVDLGCLLCFDEQTGRFIWQYSSAKLKTGRVNDWPLQGIIANPIVDGERLWIVTNRGEVVCLDTLGFQDQTNDGPFKSEAVEAQDEADVVWKFDMMKQLGIHQHNMCSCSCTCAGNLLFVVTGNGVDETHVTIPAPEAPAFIALDRRTGKLLWSARTTGLAALHGSWSSPSYAVLGGQPQVLFPGGDGWLYSFDPQGDGKGGPKLLWEFDCNDKRDQYILGGRGTRDEFITMPVIYNGRVYVATGQDVEHGSGPGQLWCIDPAKRLDGSDVSPQIIKGRSNHALTRHEARVGFKPEQIQPNPNSAVVWSYKGFDLNGDGAVEFDETFSRCCAHPSICNGLLFISDFGGIFHCLDADTGKLHWTYDSYAPTWVAVPLIVDGKVYVCDEDGDVAIFRNSKQREQLGAIDMRNSVYTAPVVANGVLYIANKSTLYAIAKPK